MKKGENAAKKVNEKREFYRLPHEFRINFKPLEFPLSEHKKKSSKIKDVSGGGLLFESDSIFKLGTVLQLELELEGWYRHRSSFFKATREKFGEPLTVIGEVVRFEKFDDNSYDIGVKFTNIYDDDHNSLIKYINFKKK